jgi:endonuclease YncB( thermonuclease family)
VEKLLSEAESSASLGKLQAYWKLGARIAKERLVQRAGYHNSVLRDLAADSGVAARTLQRAVSLHETYAKLPQKLELTWSHYRLLLQLRSRTERSFYERLAADQALSARDLRRAIAAGLFHVRSGKKPKLERPASPEYLYAAKRVEIVDGDTVDLEIDLGFDVSVRQRIRLAHLDAPELDTAEGRAARDFLAAELLAARTIVVQTRKADLHGRYLARLFLSSRQVSIEKCFGEGTYLNDLLVSERHARILG